MEAKSVDSLRSKEYEMLHENADGDVPVSLNKFTNIEGRTFLLSAAVLAALTIVFILFAIGRPSRDSMTNDAVDIASSEHDLLSVIREKLGDEAVFVHDPELGWVLTSRKGDGSMRGETKSKGHAPPLVANLWDNYQTATSIAFNTLRAGQPSRKTRLDALEKGLSWVEELWEGGSIGPGKAQPDMNGEVTQDAVMIDGPSWKSGAVGGLRMVPNATSVARRVLEYTRHSMLVGSAASDFAAMMGFPRMSLDGPDTAKNYQQYLAGNCQPNYYVNVVGQSDSCPPYTPLPDPAPAHVPASLVTVDNHDTIPMLVIDGGGDLAVGCTTNGAQWKIPGRVGDSPMVGSGAYVDNELGACGASGDGDVMLRFSPCLLAVNALARGYHPNQAAKLALAKIASYYPTFQGVLLVVDKKGNHGGYSHNWAGRKYTVQTASISSPQVRSLPNFDS